ncbi:MAG TPA: hypothetical protein VM124_00420 [Candidatus Limnocylindrales bacterium]|nr:hypothetical protein [Candidatus Limnocylindrales bacterium]
MSSPASKDTIYIDAEDEITAIIDKMRASESKIVALVLPKRSSVLQSVVNLKLLKRTASEAKKNLVLITSDNNLLPLAGAVGLHVAKTLQSKPAVPVAPAQNDNAITVDGADAEPVDAMPDPNTPVGVLAGETAAEETIELDNDSESDAAVAASAATGAAKPLNKKLRVPDFDRFRLLLFAGVALLLLLIIGGIFAFVVLPKAKIVIKTDTTSVATDLTVIANTDAKAVSIDQLVVPGLKKELKKTNTEKVPATGKRDEGTKATGKITITNCSPDIVNLSANTTFSSGTFNFLSTEAVSVPKSSYSFTPGGFVCDKNGTHTVSVVAQNGGDSYNLGARSYQIAGSPANVTAAGSDMKGGTSKIVQIVSQEDIDNAKQKVTDRLNAAATAELKSLFTADNALPLTETFAGGAPIIISTPSVNEAGSDVNVSVSIAYTELGVKQDDLKQLVEDNVKKHIDNSKQTIQDNGLGKAALRVTDKTSPSRVKFHLQAVSVAGAQLDAEGIKKEIAGKKKGATQALIQARPGIREVDIKYSPFWVHSTPKKTSHITITFEQNDSSQ